MTTWLNTPDEIASWSGALTDDADLLFYGCNLAESSEGEAFISSISALTGADVAASDDSTGSSELGGDWSLEFSVGEVDKAFVLSHSQWFGVLSTVTGTAYIDYDNDGIQDPANAAAEVGIAGVIVTGFDADGNVVDQVVTAANGTYSLNNVGNVAMRVEFTNAPTGFTDSILDTSTADPNAVASIAFTTGASNSVMNLALHRPSDITDSSDLQLVATCFFFGDGITGNEPAIYSFRLHKRSRLRGNGCAKSWSASHSVCCCGDDCGSWICQWTCLSARC